MQSKLAAARQVTQAGGSVIIASGTKPEPLTRILAGEPAGTLFLAHGATHRARKRWIGLTARPRGHYVVDAGARKALESGSEEPARHRHRRGDRRIREGRRRRDPRPGRPGVRPRTHQLRHAPTPRVSAACAPTRLARRSARALYDEVVHRDNLVLIV